MQSLKLKAAFSSLSALNKGIQNGSLLDHHKQSPFTGLKLFVNWLVSGDRAIDGNA